MELPQPRSLHDVIVDGAIAQADVDAAFAATLGGVTGVEFTTPQPQEDTPDAPVKVRVHIRGGRLLDMSGVRVARVVGGEWTWLSARGEAFDVDELRGTVPASEELVAAARTLFGNEPVLLAPHHDDAGTSSVIAVTSDLPVSTPRTAITTGISRLASGQDARRALVAFAAARGLGVQESGDRLGFSDGTVVTLADGRATDIAPGPSLAQVRDDAWFTSVEHQLLLDGRYPDREIHWAPGAPTATIRTGDGAEVTVSAEVTGVVSEGVFHWAWAWPAAGVLPPGSAALRLRDFGLEAGIPSFTVPRQDWEQVRVDKLLDAAKPVLGLWTHAIIPLATGVDVSLALDAPQLRLPAVTAATAQAVLTRDEGVSDRRRAVAAYARFRGMRVEGDRLRLPSGEEVEVDAS
ncbi:DUF6882 domain-containing protein [Corynebacterium guangdongense]|uniref:Uncharacterized protein n=1 Tax=Corynebacterium guangdongense TaxID=1783348 RepID=A0ABU1ZVB4_9CORY|nr:DUF6882 domain-containing protein [Corynebacterium guangdongense]MDR7328869.1 hypothetical protein [Corynebacterium guangdongense]WJZ17444.1 hypothetical protein CGUA_04270 [Corynebacterium guangdongense]